MYTYKLTTTRNTVPLLSKTKYVNKFIINKFLKNCVYLPTYTCLSCGKLLACWNSAVIRKIGGYELKSTWIYRQSAFYKRSIFKSFRTDGMWSSGIN